MTNIKDESLVRQRLKYMLQQPELQSLLQERRKSASDANCWRKGDAQRHTSKQVKKVKNANGDDIDLISTDITGFSPRRAFHQQVSKKQTGTNEFGVRKPLMKSEHIETVPPKYKGRKKRAESAPSSFRNRSVLYPIRENVYDPVLEKCKSKVDTDRGLSTFSVNIDGIKGGPHRGEPRKLNVSYSSAKITHNPRTIAEDIIKTSKSHNDVTQKLVREIENRLWIMRQNRYERKKSSQSEYSAKEQRRGSDDRCAFETYRSNSSRDRRRSLRQQGIGKMVEVKSTKEIVDKAVKSKQFSYKPFKQSVKKSVTFA